MFGWLNTISPNFTKFTSIKYPKIIMVAKKMKMEAFSMSGAFLLSNVSKSLTRICILLNRAILLGRLDLNMVG